MNTADLLNHIEINGNSEVIIDGANSVVGLTESAITVEQSGYSVKIKGNELKISQFTEKYIIISGELFGLEFLYD